MSGIRFPVLPGTLLAAILFPAFGPAAAEASKTASAPLAAKDSGAVRTVRPPAVAGLFYPNDAKELARAVDRFLAVAPTNDLEGVRALICPHAGYEYSGPVAAAAYKRIAGGSFDKVVILAASHYALFEGVSVPATDAYETPLGQVPVWDRARQLAKASPFVLEPRCPVQRPSWSAIPGRPRPPEGGDTTETWEHSVEVQVPFLQRTLKQFQILPVVFGRADPEKVAKALARIVDEKTLVVASSDLSHFHPYEEAGALDRQTVKWVCDRNIEGLQAPEAEERACGRMPILAVLYLARFKGWKSHLLDYRNSGDTAGDKSRVVGYCAVAFTGGDNAITPEKGAAGPQSTGAFDAVDREFLLDLARRTLKQVTVDYALPEIASNTVPAGCRVPRGCFVTLTRSGSLRGCMGNILPTAPLYQSVMENARSAALRDPRFPPVTGEETGRLHIEISVLTTPEPLAFASPEDLLAKLQPRSDGVVLKIGERGATFLPQVWEQLPDKTQFLTHLATKAGCAPDAWRGKDVSISIYHVEAFEEAK